MIKYQGILKEDETHFMDRWAAGEYPRIIDADPEYFSLMLAKYGSFIFRVDSDCFNYLMTKYEKEIRNGITSNWECVFSLSKDKFIKYYQIFENELKPHFITRPGLWFYIFRYDAMKKCKPKKGEHCTVDKKCACDINLKLCRQIMIDWKLVTDDMNDD